MAVDTPGTRIHSPFAAPATVARLEAVARALEANGFVTELAATAEDAKRAVLDLIPLGSEVHSGASTTLEALGLQLEFDSGRYDPVRPKYLKLDRSTQMPELRKLISARRSCWLAPVQLRSPAHWCWPRPLAPSLARWSSARVS